MSPALRLGALAVFCAAVVAGVVVGVDRLGREPEPDPEAYCELIARVANLDDVLGNLDTAGVQRAVAVFGEIEPVAPPEVAAAVAVIHEMLGAIAATMTEAPSGDTAALAELWRTRQSEMEQLQVASEQLVTYTRTQCGLELFPAGTTVGTTNPAADVSGDDEMPDIDGGAEETEP
ncbi:MAG TPA: hypothetical protein PKA98_23270 [Acidimicrobiales bacterium]|nr:hypothetical protein [Acidimicrobiales bacterium]